MLHDIVNLQIEIVFCMGQGYSYQANVLEEFPLIVALSQSVQSYQVA